MTVYQGVIMYRPYLFGNITRIRQGSMIKPCLMAGKMSTRNRQGINMYNYNALEFRRIPKEHILNKFKQLGGNVGY